MRIINILEIINGIPSQIESFPIYEEQLSQDIVDVAEKLFLSFVKENNNEYKEEDEEALLDDGFFDDGNGYEVYIIWSN